jgi:hypothetical protein
MMLVRMTAVKSAESGSQYLRLPLWLNTHSVILGLDPGSTLKPGSL